MLSCPSRGEGTLGQDVTDIITPYWFQSVTEITDKVSFKLTFIIRL